MYILALGHTSAIGHHFVPRPQFQPSVTTSGRHQPPHLGSSSTPRQRRPRDPRRRRITTTTREFNHTTMTTTTGKLVSRKTTTTPSLDRIPTPKDLDHRPQHRPPPETTIHIVRMPHCLRAKHALIRYLLDILALLRVDPLPTTKLRVRSRRNHPSSSPAMKNNHRKFDTTTPATHDDDE